MIFAIFVPELPWASIIIDQTVKASASNKSSMIKSFPENLSRTPRVRFWNVGEGIRLDMWHSTPSPQKGCQVDIRQWWLHLHYSQQHQHICQGPYVAPRQHLPDVMGQAIQPDWPVSVSGFSYDPTRFHP